MTPDKRTPSANGKICSRRKGRSSHWISKINRLAIYLRDGFICCYCGRDLHDAEPAEVTLDHLIPREDWPKGKSGLHSSTNLTTACRVCNCGRKRSAWRQYATPGAIERIKRSIRRVPNRKLAQAIHRGTAPMPGREA